MHHFHAPFSIDSIFTMATSQNARLALFFVALFSFGLADDNEHVYKHGEEVKLWLNKIGPYHNPQETYTYYTLPFCNPFVGEEIEKKFPGLGDALEGNELIDSGFRLTFAENTPMTEFCSQILTTEEAEEFNYAISKHYWYQFYIDDLPVWGMVGEMPGDEYKHPIINHKEDPEAQHFIFTHKQFSIGYNGDRIIEVNLTSDNPKEVRSGAELTFTYSVQWLQTTKPFEDRFNRYLDENFFEHQIHWFSLFNSFMMVIFLCGLVFLILTRTLKNDYARYAELEEDFESLNSLGDDSGWKQVHGDVFRRPDHLDILCALLGTGCQLAILILVVILLSILGSLYIDRGAITTAFVVCYALTSIVAGYAGGSLYKKYWYPQPSPHWIRVMVITATALPGICFVMSFFLNFIAIGYKTTNAIPFGTIMLIIALWLFVSIPLLLLGTLLGRNWSGTGDFPCRVNSLPRPIPEKKWFTQPIAMIIAGGILPFGSIFIEMYFVFTSFWNYKFYYVYGFMLLVFVILILVTSCISIVITYILLNSEDYRWPWISFLSPASTGAYVYLYSIQYFFSKTSMNGFLQTSFYFGYMFLFCIGLSLLCGTVGYLASLEFVRRIYRNIKSD